MRTSFLCSFLLSHVYARTLTHSHTTRWSVYGWKSTTQTRGRMAGSPLSLSLSLSLTHTYTHFIPAQHRHKLWSGCDNIIPPLRPHWGESIPNHRDRLPEPRPPSVTLPLPRLLIPQSWLQLTSPGPDERGSWGGGGEGERRGWERGRVRKNRQWEIVCMCSHMDFGANGIIRTLLCPIKEASLSVITGPICERWVRMEIVSLELQEPFPLCVFMKWVFQTDAEVIFTEHESINRWSANGH